MALAKLSRPQRDALANALKLKGFRRVYADTGIAPPTLRRALSGARLASGTVAKLSRITPKVREAGEFGDAVKAMRARPPTRPEPQCLWSVDAIRAARDSQMRGDFRQPVAMATAMRTDDALFTAYANRVAPQSALATNLVARDSARGKAVAARAALSVSAPRSTLKGIHGTLANHGVAIGYVEHAPNCDGTCVDVRLTEWPLEHVRFDATRETLVTTVRDGLQPVDIVHGDGHWIVFRSFGNRPWTQDACVLPASLLWAAHAYGLADWAGASRAHGIARVIGELPEGVPIKDEDGNLSADATAFIEMLADIVTGEREAGMRPPGAKTDFLTNQSTAWQVFSELIQNREKAAARIYLGTDATLGSVGGAPGVDIAELFGVATTRLQGDLGVIESALSTGLYEPWTAINYGDSRYAPRLEYVLPDPDADAKRAENAKNRERLHDTLKRMREEKLIVTQDVVNALAVELGVSPAPEIADIEQQSATLVLAPTDIARVVRVREARAAQGLPPFGDKRDDMTITELDVYAQASADIRVSDAESV